MLVHLNNGCAGEACILRPETVALMHGSQFTHHPQMTAMAYGFLDMELNGQRLLWHMGESPRFISILALIPQQNLGLLVSYNTPPANGRTILFNFMDTFFPYERPELSEQPLPRWEERAAQFNGTYIPARSAHSNPQALARLLNAVPVTIDEGKVDISGWHFVETEPGFFRQAGGDRLLTFAENENGQIWMFIGPLAYFRAAWYQSPLFTFALMGVSFLLFLSTWLAWPIRSVRSSRRNLVHPKRSILWLSGSLWPLQLWPAGLDDPCAGKLWRNLCLSAKHSQYHFWPVLAGRALDNGCDVHHYLAPGFSDNGLPAGVSITRWYHSLLSPLSSSSGHIIYSEK